MERGNTLAQTHNITPTTQPRTRSIGMHPTISVMLVYGLLIFLGPIPAISTCLILVGGWLMKEDLKGHPSPCSEAQISGFRHGGTSPIRQER